MTDPPIIHRDIKASNVLITEKLRAKVADFGLARLTTEGSDATHISTQVKGTTGYLDPEYLRTYQLTEKSDVYSFGVLLVELMSGRHPIEQKRSLKEKITIKWVSIGTSVIISSLDMTNYESAPEYLCTHCKYSVTKNLGMVEFAVRAIKSSFILSVEGT